MMSEWTCCEDCDNACSADDGEDLECGPGYGSPDGGGVPFRCEHFKAPPMRAVQMAAALAHDDLKTLREVAARYKATPP